MRARGLLIPVALSALLTLIAGCAGQPVAEETPQAGAIGTDAATLALLDKAIAGDHRSDATRARDRYRHPRETLVFFGFRSDMSVMEVWPGSGGWYTEILAPVLRDRGALYAAQWDPETDNKFVQDSLKAFTAKMGARPDVYDKVKVVALHYPTAILPVPAGTLDMVLTFRNIHNWMPRGADRPMLEAMFAALKPGGILGVVEHRASDQAPQDPMARSGYVREDYAIELIESIGFRLVDRSEINANPGDTRDYEQGVWTLPPTFRLGDKDRERYTAIGESDRFTLRFEKPRVE